jgi:hypothetical protein
MDLRSCYSAACGTASPGPSLPALALRPVGHLSSCSVVRQREVREPNALANIAKYFGL